MPTVFNIQKAEVKGCEEDYGLLGCDTTSLEGRQQYFGQRCSFTDIIQP
jgi:hypothetical protein